MDKKTKVWIKTMDWCSNYWGCHQIPDRSFFYKGYQFPVCARCTGIIFGYIVSIISFVYGFKLNNLYCILLIMPMILDGTIQYFTKYISNNFKRMLTGFLSGFGFIHLILNVILFIKKIIL